MSNHGTEVCGRRQVVNDRIQKGLDAFVFVRRTAKHGCDHQLDGRFAQGCTDLLLADFPFFQIGVSDVVVEIG